MGKHDHRKGYKKTVKTNIPQKKPQALPCNGEQGD
uniref:Uncharacterized protein n=1 Tax=Anguilla anguilla TaxID=7936 RepID=A0A0E9UP79_ANGAN